MTSGTRQPWLRLAGYMLPQHARVYAVFWLIMMLAWIVMAGLAVAAIFETGQEWIAGLAPPKWFLFVIGILMAAVELPTYVAHGITRRHVCLASLVTFGITAVAFGMLAVGFFWLETAILDRAGVGPEVTDPLRIGSVEDAMTLLVVTSVLFLIWAAWGWLVGAGYYRFGPWLGTLFLIPAGVPVLLAEGVTTRPGSGLRFLSSLTGGAVPAVIAVAAAAALVGSYLLVRDVPLRKVSG